MIPRWAIEALACLGIVGAVLIWLGIHDASIKSAATQAATQGIQAAQAAASAAVAIHDAKVASEQQGNLREANAQNAARETDSRALAAVVRGLHDDAVRPVAAASGAAASAGGSSGLSSDVVPGVLYRAALAAFADTADDAESLAEYSSRLRTSGQLCASDYATKVKP